MGKCVVASRQFLGVIYSNQNVLSLDCFHEESHLALFLLLEQWQHPFIPKWHPEVPCYWESDSSVMPVTFSQSDKYSEVSGCFCLAGVCGKWPLTVVNWQNVFATSISQSVLSGAKIVNVLVKWFNMLATCGHASQNRSHAVKGKRARLMYV